MLRLQHSLEKDCAYRTFAPVEWSEDLHCWCVFEPGAIAAILRSADFAVTDYAIEYGKLAERTHLDWSDILGTLDCVPLAHEGDRHAQLRRDFAQLITSRSVAAKAAVEDFVSRAVPLVFRRRRAELIDELIRPATDALFGELLGVPVPEAASNPSASQVFDRSLGLNRRKRLQVSLARLSQALAEERGLSTSVAYAKALLAVGHDSLLASLGASLVAVLEGNSALLCDIDYPPAMPRTGVPYVERTALRTCTLHGVEICTGDRVRLFLDACPARSANEEAPFFGKGRHLCLGKELSQWTWRVLTRELARLPVRVTITDTRIRANDYVFTMYERIGVAIHG